MKKLEHIGSLILGLVLIALASFPVSTPKEYTPLIMFMSIAVLVLLTTSVMKSLGNFNYFVLMILGVSLLSLGGYVFYRAPEFFPMAKDLSNQFWYTVCLYSLPAICVEGGLMTLYTIYHETNEKSVREKKLMLTTFVLYATISISTNFLAIGGLVTMAHQILLAQVIVGIAIGSCLVLFIHKHLNSA